ncbi:MAG: hypothetical protein K6W08_15470 [Firmicutes bacterium]|nr:hypothetical protein [Bacillota bacterium]
MSAPVAPADTLRTGWAALRAFFSEGMPALERAREALAAAEPAVRASGDPAQLVLWLLATATALQYTRRPEPMEAGLARARELVNLVARTQGETASVAYRPRVEAIARDLADVVPAEAARVVAEGLAYSERTVRLARQAARDDYLAPALASQGDLLVRLPDADRRARRRAVTLHAEARRRWPPRDAEGRAQAGLGAAAALLAAGEPAKAEPLLRDALAVFERFGDRYHRAAAHLLLARALLALDRAEALDAQAEAVALFRALDCRWELERAEEALA